jgi:hypothetical protein
MNNLENEIWKDVIEWEQFYQVSDLGRLKSKHQNRILNPEINPGGFYTELRGKDKSKRHRFFVHYLIWWTFVTGKIDKTIKLRHKNENNQDNRLENLLDITNKNNSQCCKVCHEDKPIAEFKLRTDNNLYRKQCNQCLEKKSKNYYQTNIDIILQKSKEWKQNNLSKVRQTRRNYYNKHRVRLNKLAAQKNKQREKIDPQYRCRRKYKSLLYNAMVKQGVSKNKRPSASFVGCDWDFFTKHIELQFTNGMRWENYGNRGWHFGHKICCKLFDLTDEKQVKLCFHYSNIRPENWLENITNQDFIPDGRRARDMNCDEKREYLNSIGIKV